MVDLPQGYARSVPHIRGNRKFDVHDVGDHVGQQWSTRRKMQAARLGRRGGKDRP